MIHFVFTALVAYGLFYTTISVTAALWRGARNFMRGMRHDD